MTKSTNIREGSWGAFFDAALLVGSFVGAVFAVNLVNLLFHKIFYDTNKLPPERGINDVLVPPAQALSAWRNRK